MGVLTDFFLATESQVASFDPEGLPADSFDTFHAKGVDTIKVDLLFAALTGRPFAEVANCGEVVSDIASEGPWIFGSSPVGVGCWGLRRVGDTPFGL